MCSSGSVVAPTCEDQIAGMGIGLASTAQIVRMHDGTITAASPGHAGSTFTVRLPMC